MCGLVGVTTKNSYGFTQVESRIAEELLFMDTLRGQDSTGVTMVRNDGTVKMIKKATWAPALMCNKEFTKLQDELFKVGKCFLGHNRKATVGDVTSENAHPFVVNNEFILMHNGSLHTHKHLADTQVDSEAIAIYLHQHWDDDATAEEKAKTLAKIGGAWALVWYDMRTEKVNIVRNAQRPMFYVEDKGTLIYASDEHMLRAACTRNGIATAPKSLPAYTLLTFDGLVLSEVALPTAPFFPPVQALGSKAPTGTCQLGTSTTTSEDKLSKNQFKKFIRFMVGKTINFNVEDFVDVNGITQWYGDKTEWDFPHELTGILENEKIIPEVEAAFGMATGKIATAFRDKDTGVIKMYIDLQGAYAETTTCQ